MEDVLDILIKTQQFDKEIIKTKYMIDEIPQKQIRLENEIKDAQCTLNEKQKRIQELKKLYKMKEGDLAENESKIAKLNNQTFAVKTNEEYRAIINEIDYLKTENYKIEDEMITILEEEEKLKDTIGAIEAETEEVVSRKETKINMLVKRKEELTEKLLQLETNFNDSFQRLPKNVKEQYKKIKKVRGKVVCLIEDETCTGCSSILTPQFLNELKKRKEILLCDNCGRILIYVPADVNN